MLAVSTAFVVDTPMDDSGAVTLALVVDALMPQVGTVPKALIEDESCEAVSMTHARLSLWRL